MAWRGYGNKGYPTYTNVPPQEGGYAHGPKQPNNWYVVETTTIERIRTPATRYINFGDQEYNRGPSMFIGPKYKPKDHHGGYEPDYVSDNENSSPPRNQGRESPPRNQGRESPPRNQRQESPPRNQGRESLIDKFRNKVQIKTSIPVKTSDLSSPNKYQPTSPVQNQPSQEAHPIKTRNLVGPNKYQPTSPEHSYPPKEAHMTRNNSYPGPDKHQPTSPMHNYPSEGNQLIRTRNLSGPNIYQPTNPTYNHQYDEDQRIRTRNLSGPNNHHPSIPGSKYGQIRHFPNPKNHWQSAGPPMTHHPLTSVTNDINEALGFLEESMNYSPHSGQFDNFSSHPHSIEPEWQYRKPTFAGSTNFQTNTIDSQEAIRRYQGSRVP